MAKYKEDDDEDEDDDDDEDDDTENSEIDDSLEDGVYRPWSTYLCACQENVSKLMTFFKLYYLI